MAERSYSAPAYTHMTSNVRNHTRRKNKSQGFRNNINTLKENIQRGTVNNIQRGTVNNMQRAAVNNIQRRTSELSVEFNVEKFKSDIFQTKNNVLLNDFQIKSTIEQALPPIKTSSKLQTLLQDNMKQLFNKSIYYKNIYEKDTGNSSENDFEEGVSNVLKKSIDFVYPILDDNDFYKLDVLPRIELYNILHNENRGEFTLYCANYFTTVEEKDYDNFFNNLVRIYKIIYKLPKGSVQHEHSFSIGHTMEFIGNLVGLSNSADFPYKIIYIHKRPENIPHLKDVEEYSLRIVRKDILESISNRLYYSVGEASGPDPHFKLEINDLTKKFEVKKTPMYSENTISLAEIENIFFITEKNKELIYEYPWAFLEFIADRSKGITANYDLQSEYLNYVADKCLEENVQEVQIKTPMSLWSWSEDGAYIKKSVRDTYNKYREISERIYEEKNIRISFIAGKGRGTKKDESKMLINVYNHFSTIITLEAASRYKIITGYDVYSQEDVSNKNESFVKLFKKLEKTNPEIAYVLHTGETNKTEYPADHNLIYAGLLDNSLRVGHAVALWKYPFLINLYREKNIGIELCPISNNLLGYVDDMRNHPALCYINNNLSVSINSDNRGLLNYPYVSFDWMDLYLAQRYPYVILKNIGYKSLLQSSRVDAYKQMIIGLWENAYKTFTSQTVETLITVPLNLIPTALILPEGRIGSSEPLETIPEDFLSSSQETGSEENGSESNQQKIPGIVVEEIINPKKVTPTSFMPFQLASVKSSK
jgi:hypothetical protein